MLPYRPTAGVYLYSEPALPTMTSYEPTKAEQWKSTAHKSAASSLSGLSSLEDEEDDFGRLMIQNARAEKRLRELLSGKKVTPFRRAHKYSMLTAETLSRRQPGQVNFNASEHVENWIPEVDQTMAAVDEAPVVPEEEDVPFGHVFYRYDDPRNPSYAQMHAQPETSTMEFQELQTIDADDVFNETWPSKLDAGTPAAAHFPNLLKDPPVRSAPSTKSSESVTESLKRRIVEMGAPRLPRDKTARSTSTPPETVMAAKPDTPTEMVFLAKPDTPFVAKCKSVRDPNEPLRALSRLLAPKTSPTTKEELRPSPIRPRNLPTSALASIVADCKRRGKKGAAFGESTIDSLEGIVYPPKDEHSALFDNLSDNEDEEAEPIVPKKEQIVAEPIVPKKAQPIVPKKEQRVDEIDQLAQMNAKLTATRSSIKDTNRGMRRLEEEVIVTEKAAEVHAACFCHSCNQKQRRGPHVAPRSSRSSAPTWVFLSLLVLVAWYILETTLCYHFCQPAYAATMTGYGVDPHAPEVPFVTLTLATRPLVWLYKCLF